jgi:secreted Zn-dependent insulinase-like peptidase
MLYHVSNKTFTASQIVFVKLQQNPYIPNKLNLVLNKFTEELILLNNDSHRIWFKYNTSLKKPVAIISALIFMADWQEMRPICEIHKMVVIEMARQAMKYYAMAGYDAEIKAENAGIVIKVSGWNEGIFEFFSRILEIFLNPNTDLFVSAKKTALSILEFNKNQESYEKAVDYLNRLIVKEFLSADELINATSKVSKVGYLYFLQSVKLCSIDLFVMGNLNPPSGVSDILAQYFEYDDVKKSYKKSLLISGYHTFVAATENENAILNWYEFGKYDTHTYMIAYLINVFLSDQAYISLRSQAQLGYSVFLDDSSKFYSNALYLIVQGDKYTPAEMQTYISNFWESVNISQKDVENTREIIKYTTSPPDTYDEIFEEVWNEISTGRLEFKEREKMMEEIDSVTYEEVLDMLKKVREHTSELSIRMYVDIGKSHEETINLDFYRDRVNIAY